MLIHYYSVSLLALSRNTLIAFIKISLSTVYSTNSSSTLLLEQKRSYLLKICLQCLITYQGNIKLHYLIDIRLLPAYSACLIRICTTVILKISNLFQQITCSRQNSEMDHKITTFSYVHFV